MAALSLCKSARRAQATSCGFTPHSGPVGKTSFTTNQQPESVSIVAQPIQQRRQRERKDMRKYAALHSHLNRRNGRPEMLTFEDIEQIIGKPLPVSAHKHRSFWANDNQDHHSHARAWMRAGYRVAYVDRDQKVIRFERTR
jgi:hypothetical protein